MPPSAAILVVGSVLIFILFPLFFVCAVNDPTAGCIMLAVGGVSWRFYHSCVLAQSGQSGKTEEPPGV